MPQECTTRNATIVYATHIFDGLEHWPTHVAYMEGGSMVRFGAWSSFPELAAGGRLLHVIQAWLLEEKKRRRAAKKQQPQKAAPQASASPFANLPSRHMAFYH